MEISGGSLAVAISNNGTLGISGNISDDNGRESLTLASADGTGQLILSGSNSYGGGTIVQSGTLIAENARLPNGRACPWAGAIALFASALSGSPMVSNASAVAEAGRGDLRGSGTGNNGSASGGPGCRIRRTGGVRGAK